ncbi:MAG: FecR domain-containing protein [Sandaracinaceae bacterium]
MLLFLAACGAAPTTTLAQDLMDVEVREGDTCRGLARRVYGDADAFPRIHEHNPGMGPMPHRLRAGTVLRLPRPRPPATVSAVQRRVERRQPRDDRFTRARPGEALTRGAQLRTHAQSSAELTFEDESRVTVREQTLVIVYGGRRQLTSRRITRAELERGALRSRLGELAGRRPLEIETPSSTASLDGDAVVSVEDDGTSRVANHSRRDATVTAGGRRVVVPAGTGTVVRRGQRPSTPRPLLAAPRWLADLEGPVVGWAGRGATLQGGFSPVEGAARYRVEIARDPEGGEILETLGLPGEARRFEARQLDEGTVYVSIASIGPHGLEGRRSPWRAFSIRHARLVEPGGQNASVQRPVPEVWPGTWLVAPRGMQCIDGSSTSEALSAIVTLREPGTRAIRCVDRSGHAAPPLTVDVLRADPSIEGTPTLDRSIELRLRLGLQRRLPVQTLRMETDAGRVTALRDGPRAGLTFELWLPPDGPDEVTLRPVVLAGTEPVPLGEVTLRVHTLRVGASAPPPESDPSVPATRPHAAQNTWGDAAWPSALGLRDERLGGVGASLQFVAAAAEADPQLRFVAGARAQIPDTPLRLGFGSQLDLAARPPLPGRRGDADLVAAVGLLLLDEGAGGLALDVTGFLPTRSEPESLGRIRLLPSLEASLRPIEWLVLRTRQGAILDAAEEGARLWAFAAGFDVAPLPWLAIGAELDGSAGSFADLEGVAALAAGLGLEARSDLIHVAAGVRFGLTDEGRSLYGEWSATLAVRLHAQ